MSAVLWTFVSSNDALAYRGGFLLAALATTAVLFSVVCSQRSVLAQVSLGRARCATSVGSPMACTSGISRCFIYLDHARTGLTGYPLFAVRVAVTAGGRHRLLLRD